MGHYFVAAVLLGVSTWLDVELTYSNDSIMQLTSPEKPRSRRQP